MSTTLRKRLDPVTHVPDRSVSGASRDAHTLARAILSETYPAPEYQHYARSALAGAAVYVSSVIIDGEASISQPAAAEACGTTPMSIRTHTARLAGLAARECDVSWLDAAARDRLRDIVEVGDVSRVKTSRGSEDGE